MSKFSILFAVLLGISFSGWAAAPSGENQLEQKAQSAAQDAAYSTLVPHEVNTIKFKREVMGRAGLQLYVILMNDWGQPVDYFVTDGKCASSNKRLTANWEFQNGQTGKDSDGYAVYGDFVMPVASLDGTFGSSDNYIYCKTADGKYKQWNGKYYVSDAPIEVSIEPIVVERR